MAPDHDRDRQRQDDPELAPESFRIVAGVLVMAGGRVVADVRVVAGGRVVADVRVVADACAGRRRAMGVRRDVMIVVLGLVGIHGEIRNWLASDTPHQYAGGVKFVSSRA
jgi:hypothetical protein